jgi:5-methylcytosine-specific restriction endonuclease McrBC regulatory subunit McrC
MCCRWVLQEEVQFSSLDYKSDFSKYIPDRNMKDYTTALLWSKVFLMGKSFTSFAGSEVAVALLFPMETLFESYIRFVDLFDRCKLFETIMIN